MLNMIGTIGSVMSKYEKQVLDGTYHGNIYLVYFHSAEPDIYPSLYAYTLNPKLAKAFMDTRNNKIFELKVGNMDCTELLRLLFMRGTQKIHMTKFRTRKLIDDINEVATVEIAATESEELKISAHGQRSLRDLIASYINRVGAITPMMSEKLYGALNDLCKYFDIDLDVHYSNESIFMISKQCEVDELEIFFRMLGNTLSK